MYNTPRNSRLLRERAGIKTLLQKDSQPETSQEYKQLILRYKPFILICHGECCQTQPKEKNYERMMYGRSIKQNVV
jgi:hypothetical protein